MRQVLFGLLFAALWASASVATKFGLQSVPPLVLANVRFFLAGALMLLYAYTWHKPQLRWPQGAEWRQLALFGLLNTSLFLGIYVFAMQQVSAGIGSLAPATNPLFIALLSAVWTKRTPRATEVGGLLLGLAGVGVATYPLLADSHATLTGLVLMLLAMLVVSAATIYYTSVRWGLPNVAINGWQVLLAGFQLLPVTLLTTDWHSVNLDGRFWASVGWLIVPVSIVAVQLWLYLIRLDAVRASLFLFLCPIFGFVYAYWLMNEPITAYTYAGTVLVLVGLWLGRRR